MAKTREALGPRGGKTTVSPGGLLKKTVYLQADEFEALRREAFDSETSMSDLIRAAVRRYFALDRPPADADLAAALTAQLRRDKALRERVREFLLENSADSGPTTRKILRFLSSIDDQD